MAAGPQQNPTIADMHSSAHAGSEGVSSGQSAADQAAAGPGPLSAAAEVPLRRAIGAGLFINAAILQPDGALCPALTGLVQSSGSARCQPCACSS